MTTDARVQRLQREVAAAERALRDLQRRKDREPALRNAYYQLKVSLMRSKAQLAAARDSAASTPPPPGGENPIAPDPHDPFA